MKPNPRSRCKRLIFPVAINWTPVLSPPSVRVAPADRPAIVAYTQRLHQTVRLATSSVEVVMCGGSVRIEQENCGGRNVNGSVHDLHRFDNSRAPGAPLAFTARPTRQPQPNVAVS